MVHQPSKAAGSNKQTQHKPFCVSAHVKRRIAEAESAVNKCYETILAPDARIAGTILIQFVIGLDGKVYQRPNSKLSTKVIRSDLSDNGLTDCVVDVVHGLTFDKPKGGVCMIRHPFKFTPRNASSVPHVAATQSAKRFCEYDRLERQLKTQLLQVRACYETALKTIPSLKGRIVVTFGVGFDGRIHQLNGIPFSKISNSDLKDDALHSCVLEKVNGFTFEKPSGGWCMVTIPVIFSTPAP